jgi:hypothetical protein
MMERNPDSSSVIEKWNPQKQHSPANPSHGTIRRRVSGGINPRIGIKRQKKPKHGFEAQLSNDNLTCY